MYISNFMYIYILENTDNDFMKFTVNDIETVNDTYVREGERATLHHQPRMMQSRVENYTRNM